MTNREGYTDAELTHLVADTCGDEIEDLERTFCIDDSFGVDFAKRNVKSKRWHFIKHEARMQALQKKNFWRAGSPNRG